MRSTHKIILPILVAIAFAYIGYQLDFPTYDIRYRLTLDLNVNGKPVKSMGIVETRYEVGTDIFVSLGSSSLGGRFLGNAITIDLGSRGLLFIVNYPSREYYLDTKKYGRQNSENLAYLPFIVFGLPLTSRPSRRGEVMQSLLQHQKPIDVPLGFLPMFVRFRDINDPSTNIEVDPENLEATYGSNVKLVKATLELTKDSRGELPENWPAWLKQKSIPLQQEWYGPGGFIRISLGTFPFKGQ